MEAWTTMRRHIDLSLDIHPQITLVCVIIVDTCDLFIPYRAEKERSQYFGEVNDLRHSLDQTANEKV